MSKRKAPPTKDLRRVRPPFKLFSLFPSLLFPPHPSKLPNLCFLHLVHWYHLAHHSLDSCQSFQCTCVSAHLLRPLTSNELDRRPPRKALWSCQKYKAEAALRPSQAEPAEQSAGKASDTMEHSEQSGGGEIRRSLGGQTSFSQVGPRWPPKLQTPKSSNSF